jgi:hypothetical protein
MTQVRFSPSKASPGCGPADGVAVVSRSSHVVHLTSDDLSRIVELALVKLTLFVVSPRKPGHNLEVFRSESYPPQMQAPLSGRPPIILGATPEYDRIG